MIPGRNLREETARRVGGYFFPLRTQPGKLSVFIPRVILVGPQVRMVLPDNAAMFARAALTSHRVVVSLN